MTVLTGHPLTILRFLANNPSTPTEVGMQVGGKEYNRASAWACPKLASLVKNGFAERTKRGSKILYQVTESGQKQLT